MPSDEGMLYVPIPAHKPDHNPARRSVHVLCKECRKPNEPGSNTLGRSWCKDCQDYTLTVTITVDHV